MRRVHIVVTADCVLLDEYKLFLENLYLQLCNALVEQKMTFNIYYDPRHTWDAKQKERYSGLLSKLKSLPIETREYFSNRTHKSVANMRSHMIVHCKPSPDDWILMLDSDIIFKGEVIRNLVTYAKTAPSNLDVISASFIDPFNTHDYKDYVSRPQEYTVGGGSRVNNFRLFKSRVLVPIRASCTHGIWRYKSLKVNGCLEAWSKWPLYTRSYDIVTSQGLRCACMPMHKGYFIHLGYDKPSNWTSNAIEGGKI